ncbi:co-chaperone GroES [Candidatus Saccharibacteria bacterium]|nr:co-chaperone GroES [Candidatus Saccharibacteria bacterium]
MKLNPLTNHVVAKLETPAKKTASGLLLPDTNKTETAYAVVEATGPDATKNIKIGDKIIYKEYTATNVELENEKYIIVEDKDVLATL